MKILHISDLHLGKRLNEFSLLEDQRHILAQILHIVEEEKPQAVIIAGDVYDKSVPSAEAVQLFDGFLNDLVRRGTQVFAVSGNHDSAERIAFGAELLSISGVHLSPVYDGSVKAVTLEDEFGPVHFFLLPFVKPLHVRRFFPEEPTETYTQAVSTAIAHMEIPDNERNILVAHQFVTGAALCDSEEVSVGGLDNVNAAVFAPFDYVALGHIHGPQNIGSERIRYCGTPLKYSFSECNHRKSVTVLELAEKGTQTLRTIPLSPLRDIREARGTFAELIAAGPCVDYLHLILTDEEDIPNAMGRLQQIYPYLMAMDYDNTRTRTQSHTEGAADVERKSDMELFAEFFLQQNGQPMGAEQAAFVTGLLEKLKEDAL